MRYTEIKRRSLSWRLLPAADREPDRRTLGTESGSEPCRGNVSDRPFFWSAVYAKSGCPMRYTEIKRRSLSWSLLPAAGREPDRAGGRWEQNPAQRLIVAMFPTARSFGVLFMRKADARCAIRKSSVEIYLGVSFPAAGREPDRTSGRREWNPAPAPCRGVLESPAPLEVGIRRSCASAGHAQD